MADTKTITVQCTWESLHDVEVPADFDCFEVDSLDSFPPGVADQLTSHTASLVDWEVSGGS